MPFAKEKEKSMKLEVQKEYALIPAGEHILKLSSCDVQEFEDRYGKSNSGKVERLKFRIVSNETDDDGTPYDFVVYTGMTYGNEKAGLTKLIDMLVPGMTEKQFADFDTDDLVGKKFRAQIKHVKKDDGKMKPDFVYMAPIVAGAGKGRAAAAPEPNDDVDLDDPFADSDNYKKAA